MKITALLLFSIGIFFAQTWWGMGAFTLVALLAFAFSRVPLKAVVVPLAPVLVLATFAAVFAFIAAPGWESLSDGLFVAVRMVVLVLASFVVCLTTTSTALLAAFSWFIRPFRALGVPVDDIAFTLALAIRFMPVVAGEFVQVRQAQSARGGQLEQLSFRRRLEVWGAAFSAVFVGLFRHADILASSMESRCYGANDRRSSLREEG